ncbi:MAG: hypothetical protein V2I40_10030 [Desulfobacteraceae bacterium]|jgi:hypothetical protein|nr:hypothetical protein [Desulfobacteraceae bacterium]
MDEWNDRQHRMPFPSHTSDHFRTDQPHANYKDLRKLESLLYYHAKAQSVQREAENNVFYWPAANAKRFKAVLSALSAFA